MEITLIWILDKKTGIKRYYGVTEKEYDGMLACGGSHFYEENYEWGWLGDVTISEKALNYQGYFYRDE